MLGSHWTYILGLLINIAAGLLVYILLSKVWLALLCFLLLSSLGLFISNLYAYHVLGFRDFRKVREGLKLLRECVDLTKRQMDYLGVVPTAHISESKLLEKLRPKIEHGCKFRFLVLDPSSKKAAERIIDGGSYLIEQMEDSIKMLLKLKRQLGDLGENLMVAIYDEYPVWCIGLIDERICFLSFYPRGKSGLGAPAISLKPGEHSFYEACWLHFNKLWDRATEMKTYDMFSEYLSSRKTEDR